MKINSLLLTDFYKATHHAQYPEGLEFITSYFVPRMPRVPMTEVVHFGLMGVVQEYLIEHFNENFFNCPFDEVISEYEKVLELTLGEKPAKDASSRVASLHKLGYLPIKISAMHEGLAVPMGVPTFEITNTHKDFVWVVNALETLLSTSMWHQMVSATVAREYRKVVDKYFEMTVGEESMVDPMSLIGDFSLRGQESIESGVHSSAAFLTAFNKTATIPAILYLDKYYNLDSRMSLKDIATGSISTEHSVMCSNFSVDGDEKTFVKKLLTEIYPNDSFSMVSDSYDYWNMVNVILPSLREEIEAHNGTLLVRGDSGNPIEIVTETVFSLWGKFGGTINSKGYKVLNPKIRVVYGDGITINRAKEIYAILESNRFSIENVVLGMGSFSMQALESDGQLLPFTRDTFGIAIKATHGVMSDGKEIFILKDPKTDTDNFKKSHQGLINVYVDNNGMFAQDGLKQAVHDNTYSLLAPIFVDGELTDLGRFVNSLDNIRSTMQFHNK